MSPLMSHMTSSVNGIIPSASHLALAQSSDTALSTSQTVLATSHKLPTTFTIPPPMFHMMPSTSHVLSSTTRMVTSTSHNLPSARHMVPSTSQMLISTNHMVPSTSHMIPPTNHTVPSNAFQLIYSPSQQCETFTTTTSKLTSSTFDGLAPKYTAALLRCTTTSPSCIATSHRCSAALPASPTLPLPSTPPSSSAPRLPQPGQVTPRLLHRKRPKSHTPQSLKFWGSMDV